MTQKKLKIYKNSTGLLVPISLEKDIPFIPKRVFIIHGKKNSIRGDHAHHKCSQFLIPLSGTMVVEYENRKGKYIRVKVTKNTITPEELPQEIEDIVSTHHLTKEEMQNMLNNFKNDIEGMLSGHTDQVREICGENELEMPEPVRAEPTSGELEEQMGGGLLDDNKFLQQSLNYINKLLGQKGGEREKRLDFPKEINTSPDDTDTSQDDINTSWLHMSPVELQEQMSKEMDDTY